MDKLTPQEQLDVMTGKTTLPGMKKAPQLYTTAGAYDEQSPEDQAAIDRSMLGAMTDLMANPLPGLSAEQSEELREKLANRIEATKAWFDRHHREEAARSAKPSKWWKTHKSKR